MKNVTEKFNECYLPFKALVLYLTANDNRNHYGQQRDNEQAVYVESYDIGKQGQPINAHPLSLREMAALSELLNVAQEKNGNYLKCKGVMPASILQVSPGTGGFALWYTPPMSAQLFFVERLQIPSGKVQLPGLIWKADREHLYLYAYKGSNRPHEHTPLCHAPFPNMYDKGNVCMGTVNVQIGKSTSLETFIRLWQQYFFNSEFSHSINGNSSTQADIIPLYRRLRENGEPFPQKELIPNGQTLKHLFI